MKITADKQSDHTVLSIIYIRLELSLIIHTCMHRLFFPMHYEIASDIIAKFNCTFHHHFEFDN